MARTDLKIDTPVTRGRSGPVLYELIDKDGRVMFSGFPEAHLAARMAQDLWPDQPQDPDRTGAGWDVQVVGA